MIQTDVVIHNTENGVQIVDHVLLDTFLNEIPAAKILLLHEDADHIYDAAVATLPNGIV